MSPAPFAAPLETKGVVMLVDDAPASCESFANALWFAAFDVVFAPCAATARQMLERGIQADIVVINLLPAGRELWVRSRTALVGLRMPVVALTKPSNAKHGTPALDPPALVAIVKAILHEHARRQPS